MLIWVENLFSITLSNFPELNRLFGTWNIIITRTYWACYRPTKINAITFKYYCWLCLTISHVFFRRIVTTTRRMLMKLLKLLMFIDGSSNLRNNFRIIICCWAWSWSNPLGSEQTLKLTRKWYSIFLFFVT